MMLEKKEPLTKFLESRINRKIAESGAKEFIFSIIEINEAMKYEFEKNDLVQLIESIYIPLGYTVRSGRFQEANGNFSYSVIAICPMKPSSGSSWNCNTM